ncbi:probable BOI-related E3 ubiquitin-protein ligase 3 [Macadamia integrifolia]|uniref:probable BOI-related E3 ubiquitin-protein ligase 3 n=1 Tax=Macadamia integrifolia TaxID=60698 RepID=UPI001C4E85C8|nr:probable BOI-related E3 ubiquitin-protein ligase 3 [Macadamia integrifolia]
MMAVQAQQYQENLVFGINGSQEWMDSCGGLYDFYLNPQQQEQMQQLQNINLMRNHNLGFENSLLVSSPSCQSNLLSMAFSDSLAAQIDKQALEIDRYILLQNERLRSVLQEQMKNQLAILLRRMESKMMSLLTQKDEEIARESKRTMELEECLRRMEMENQAWQRVAKENEAMVMALNNTLEQVKENAYCFPSAGAEDVESCCDISDQAHYREEKRRDDEEEEEQEEESMRKMTCKSCNSQRSCVLFLPCRHLCSCKSCEAFLDSCPVCNSPKKASMEVYML